MITRKPASTELSKIKVSGKTDISQFPNLGIGASAGGLEALELFYENMPKDNGMAFIIIQHLGQKYKDLMPGLLQQGSFMKVVQASDNLKV